MFNKTFGRVDARTSPSMKQRFHRRMVANVRGFINADQHQIDRRMKELDKEWNVERVIEVEAPLMMGLGTALGLLHNRKWFVLSGVAASMVVLHNTRGYHPSLPLLQRLGFRPQKDIEDERNALRVLRRDHERYVRH